MQCRYSFHGTDPILEIILDPNLIQIRHLGGSNFDPDRLEWIQIKGD
jgi:hypothetical protein